MVHEELPSDGRVLGRSSLKERNFDGVVRSVIFSGVDEKYGETGLRKARSQRTASRSRSNDDIVVGVGYSLASRSAISDCARSRAIDRSCISRNGYCICQ